jgi:L-ribulose-5-phosphate 3-epimerase
MKKGINYWAMKDGLAGTHPIDDALAQAASAGFEALELCIGTEGALTTDMTEAECAALRQTIDASGIIVETVACALTWAHNPTSDDPAVRRRSIDLHKAAVERTAWLGCEAMLMVPGVVNSPITPEESIPYPIAVERSRDAVGEILNVADRVGVDLCLENVWNGLFLSPMEFATFIDFFQSDRLGIYFDVGNIMRYHQHPPHWIDFLGDRIKRVHIKDFAETFDWQGTYAFADLCEGNVPWAETIDALRAIGYGKPLIAEMMPYRDDLLEKTSRAMDNILGRDA